MSGRGSGGLPAVLALALLALGACGPRQLSISVKSPVGTNMGRPLYMLVRQVDSKQYANEAYSEVAARVGVPDATVLQTSVIYPGTIQRFLVKTPKEGSVALSFLTMSTQTMRSITRGYLIISEPCDHISTAL